MNRLLLKLDIFKQPKVFIPILIVFFLIMSAISETGWIENIYLFIYFALIVYATLYLYGTKRGLSEKDRKNQYDILINLKKANNLRIIYLTPTKPNNWFTTILQKLTKRHTICLYKILALNEIFHSWPDCSEKFTVSSKMFFNLKLKGMIETEDVTVAMEALDFIGTKKRLPQ